MNLLRNFKDLVEVIKKIVIETMNTNYPLTMMYGTVISTSPLKINVEQKMVLESSFLILTRNVTNYSASVNIDGQNRTVTIPNALKRGDNVILLREQGGQKFVVMDKVVKT